MNHRIQDSIVKALAAAIGLAGFIGLSSLASTGETGAAVGDEPPPSPPAAPKTSSLDRPPRVEDAWKDCAEVRTAGAAPLRRGDPGFRPAMDRDGDGVACEVYSER